MHHSLLLIPRERTCSTYLVARSPEQRWKIVKNVTWYKERQLTEISLGGLLILVVIRTIQFNMTRMRDKYLHTNCLAALANMSSEFTNLNSFVAQKIVQRAYGYGVLNYFSTRLEPLGTNPSSKDVLQTIKDAGMTFKKDKLKVSFLLLGLV
ncbi:hypothetical protein EGW08_017679 [Elysia chlorotica]|uniref:Dymeclin n=1 Tax=Elysia chlorotica TaxID=188477 RepID=A0A3S0ZGV3_ELYCH|nr:hypothetical protein EGW08_017679 [Elysia chlorotica]